MPETVSSVSRRLGRHYDAALRAGRVARGRRWYPTANALLRAAAEDSGYTLEQAAAVFAIVSPGAQLVSNFEWTRAALQSRGRAPVGRYPNAMAPKVRRALNDVDFARETVSGPKVSAFFAAVLGDVNALVLDRWALFAAAGAECQSPTVKQRDVFSAAYFRAAESKGETVSAFQASVWLQVRETTPNARGIVRKLRDIV